MDKATIKRELFAAVTQLSSRGILHAAKWVAELLECFESVPTDPAQSPSDPRLRDTSDDIEKYTLAKTYFDLKEYYRAAFTLEGCRGQRSVFLRSYSRFLAGEKRKQEEAQENGERNPAVNRQLPALKDELGKLHAEKKLDGFSTWLYGIILGQFSEQTILLPREELIEDNFNAKKKFEVVSTKDTVDATQRAVLIEAIKLYPWNWSAWVDLSSVLKDAEMIHQVDNQLPQHFFKPFWRAHSYLELQQNQNAHEIYLELLDIFPTSTFLKCQIALARYNLQDFESAQQIFEELLQTDPHRVQNLDIYSNILYVRADSAKLSHLAYKASSMDKYSVETCCIIGNYYSLKGEHEKAISYFERALKLNPKYLSAWTLIGHEFVELRNTSAAIAAYRKAVDINPRDYRAWYGLGNTYELLKMPLYALYYYSRTCALRPYDPRMWIAMGSCYTLLGQPHHIENAIICYKRAEYNHDRDGIALGMLAKLYEDRDDDKAAYYHKKQLDRRDAEGIEGQETIDSLVFLAKHCKARGHLDDAALYATRLLDYTGPQSEEAKSLLREIQAHKGLKQFSSSIPDSPLAINSNSNSRWGPEGDDDILLDPVGQGSPIIPISPIGASGTPPPSWRRRSSLLDQDSSMDMAASSPSPASRPPAGGATNQSNASMDMDME